MNLTGIATRNLIRRLEYDAKESIREIEAGKLPLVSKRQHKAEILKEFAKTRVELELQSIRTNLEITKDSQVVKAEMYWADEDMKSDRCPEMFREIFRTHVFECSALLHKLTA